MATAWRKSSVLSFEAKATIATFASPISVLIHDYRSWPALEATIRLKHISDRFSAHIQNKSSCAIGTSVATEARRRPIIFETHFQK